ncbi:MAG: hypothetical protein E7214_08245 [Clostridium sp.]|nr:hypothetical protein [Clostridium sp.]
MEELKRIINKIVVNQYTVYFSYATRKGNYREQQVIVNATSEENAKEVFKKWAEIEKDIVNFEILGTVKAAKKENVIEI